MLNKPKIDNIELTIPADSSMLLVVRLTTAGVLARAPIGVDKLDDAKMAVEEACNCFVEQLDAGERIYLCFNLNETALTISMRNANSCNESDKKAFADVQELKVIQCLLEALVDNVELNVCNNRIHEIRMHLSLKG